MNARVYIKKRRIATFKGKHNRSKSKVLLLLYHVKHHQEDTSGRTARWLYINSGVPYSSLQSRLGQWAKWGYVTRHTSKGLDGKPCWYYRLGIKGKKFVENILNVYAPEMIPQYLQEMKDFQKVVTILDRKPNEYRTIKKLMAAIEEKKREFM